MGRINEYTPFKIENAADKEWLKQDISICMKYCEDFIHTIIPFVEKKYNTYKSKEHRAIYGSSLAAITALYLSYHYEDSFQYVGAFSTPSFLFKDAFFKFLKENINKRKDVFLYVGAQEQSDDIYDKNTYLNSSKELYQFFKENKIRTRLVIDTNGIHNEATWGNHISDFINFIYFDDILYSI
jgi:alpha-glucosidase